MNPIMNVSRGCGRYGSDSLDGINGGFRGLPSGTHGFGQAFVRKDGKQS